MQDAAQVGRNLVREPARIGRCADDDKRISGKVKYCFTLCRGIQRDETEGDTERLSGLLCGSGDECACGSGRTEIQSDDRGYAHGVHVLFQR